MDDAMLGDAELVDPDLSATILAVPGVELLYGVRSGGNTVAINLAVDAASTVPMTLRSVREAVALLFSTEVAPPTISVKASRIV